MHDGRNLIAHLDLVPAKTTQQRPNGHAEPLSFQIPQRDVEAGQSRHQDFSASVELASVGVFVDVVDIVGRPSDEPFREGFQRSFDRFRMSASEIRQSNHLKSKQHFRLTLQA